MPTLSEELDKKVQQEIANRTGYGEIGASVSKPTAMQEAGSLVDTIERLLGDISRKVRFMEDYWHGETAHAQPDETTDRAPGLIGQLQECVHVAQSIDNNCSRIVAAPQLKRVG